MRIPACWEEQNPSSCGKRFSKEQRLKKRRLKEVEVRPVCLLTAMGGTESKSIAIHQLSVLKHKHALKYSVSSLYSCSPLPRSRFEFCSLGDLCLRGAKWFSLMNTHTCTNTPTVSGGHLQKYQQQTEMITHRTVSKYQH